MRNHKQFLKNVTQEQRKEITKLREKQKSNANGSSHIKETKDKDQKENWIKFCKKSPKFPLTIDFFEYE